MELVSEHTLIIITSIILIISYFFGELAKKTNVPSVLMLIVLGIVFNIILINLDISYNFFPILKVLGTVGLIMIVLEAALELKLEKDKLVPIARAFLVALVGLLLSAWVTAIILEKFIPGMDTMHAWLYATPLSILSSAIIIPSVNQLRADKKEFHIYESTFSDILGIMMFYFIGAQIDSHGDGGGVGAFAISTLLTVVLAVLSSYLIVIIFQNIRGHVKLFLLISVLLLLYSVGKKMHLSPLLIILMFGLTIANIEVFFKGFIEKFLNREKAQGIYEGLHVITAETAFVVRTFFFVIFGMTITFDSLTDLSVMGVSAMCLAIIYIIRWVILRLSVGEDLLPQLFIVPRGLVTVLLFYNITPEQEIAGFDQGILLWIIIGTSLIMTFSMIWDKKRSNKTINKAKSLPVKTVRWKAPGLDE